MKKHYKKLWKCAIDIGIKAGHDLRERLNLDEDNFRFRTPYSHKNSRNVYIYRAIDETQKAATCLMRWKEFFSDKEEGSYRKDIEKQMMRITQQAVFDEQSLRCRKLTELLVDTILFLNTNEDIYFKDYFYFNELVEYQREQKDRKEFFNFINRNSEEHIQWLKKQILALENSGFNLNKRWYLSKPKSIISLNQISLSSFRSRYKKISIEQGPEIITLLAKSYLQAYSESRDVHFSADDTSYRFNDESPLLTANKVALLLINVIVKLQELSLLEFEETNGMLSGIRATIQASEPYVQLTTPQVDIGEYVLALGDLGRVIEEQKSRYGYYSYHVKYIGKPPIESIKDDWFASFQILRIGSKDDLLKKVKSIFSKHCAQEIDDNALATISDTEFEQYLNSSVRDVLKLMNKI